MTQFWAASLSADISSSFDPASFYQINFHSYFTDFVLLLISP